MRLKLKKSQAGIVDKYVGEHSIICGIDEVGRGPIAGPVVSCAVVMPLDHNLEEIKDSKKLSDKKRRKLAKEIYEDALAVGFGVVDEQTIDDINIRQATLLSMNLAVLELQDKKGQKIKPDLLLIDAEQIDNDIDQIAVIGGDDTVYQISCASILAKVFRDNLMIEYNEIYPGYDFDRHKGYGTKAHYHALDQLGPSKIHRKTFLRKYYEKLQEINRNNGRRNSL